jgi:hypothetical protein
VDKPAIRAQAANTTVNVAMAFFIFSTSIYCLFFEFSVRSILFSYPPYSHSPCQEAEKEPGSLKTRPRAGGKFMASLPAVLEIM